MKNTAAELIKASKTASFSNMNYLIQNSGLSLEIIHESPLFKTWKVRDNKEFCFISNHIKALGENKSELTFCFND